VCRADEALAEADVEGVASGSGGSSHHKRSSRDHASGSSHAHNANPKVNAAGHPFLPSAISSPHWLMSLHLLSTYLARMADRCQMAANLHVINLHMLHCEMGWCFADIVLMTCGVEGPDVIT
jgi:hypothetical protein